MTQDQIRRETATKLILRLRGERASDEVKQALTGPAKLYLESWVIPSLEVLAQEKPSREELELALSMAS